MTRVRKEHTEKTFLGLELFTTKKNKGAEKRFFTTKTRREQLSIMNDELKSRRLKILPQFLLRV